MGPVEEKEDQRSPSKSHLQSLLAYLPERDLGCEATERLREEEGENGDLYIQIEVNEHPWFERDGSDLLMALPLGFVE